MTSLHATVCDQLSFNGLKVVQGEENGSSIVCCDFDSSRLNFRAQGPNIRHAKCKGSTGLDFLNIAVFSFVTV